MKPRIVLRACFSVTFSAMATNFTGIFNCTAEIIPLRDGYSFGLFFSWNCTQYPSLTLEKEPEKLNCTIDPSLQPPDAELSGIFNCTLTNADTTLEPNGTDPTPGVSYCTQYPSVESGIDIWCTRPSTLQSYSSFSGALNCTHYPSLQPDSDISGIGVRTPILRRKHTLTRIT